MVLEAVLEAELLQVLPQGISRREDALQAVGCIVVALNGTSVQTAGNIYETARPRRMLHACKAAAAGCKAAELAWRPLESSQ